MIITSETQLRVQCSPVLSDEVNDLRSKLETALDWSNRQGRPGVGLACPQIGIPKQMFIIRVGNIKIDSANASIAKKYSPYIFDGEGCLSFPDRFEKTLRHKEILVENNLIYPHKFILTDFLAVVFEHENAHLEGVLLPDMAIR